MKPGASPLLDHQLADLRSTIIPPTPSAESGENFERKKRSEYASIVGANIV